MAFNWIKRQTSTINSYIDRRTPNVSQNVQIVGTVHEEIDSKAALNSFKGHWAQSWAVMQQKCVPSIDRITADDITCVVNHLDHMITLLIQESNGAMQQLHDPSSSSSPLMMSQLLDYLLMESILDKLLSWSTHTGEWNHIMKLEQLKLYELLLSQLCHRDALFQKPLVRPLLNLLSQFVDKVCPLEVEKRLVVLLNTLCVCLGQNVRLLELFFLDDPLISSHRESRFLIFSLLIPYVHREGAIGQQARDALLVCMALSRNNDDLGYYIAEESNFCPVLATGLSGLYSSLPRKLPVSSDSPFSADWFQLTPADTQEIVDLENFLNSLEFCNAVVQISHPLAQQQLLDYVYNGFLVSVVGPALHQDVADVPLKILEKMPKYSNTLDEIIATTAYLELFLRTVSEPILLRVFLKFICAEKFEDQRIIETLIMRINAQSKLSLITLSLFCTLLNLNCEDILLELILKYLGKCRHLIGDDEQKVNRIKDLSSFNISAQKFLTLIPFCCYSLPSYNLITALDDGYQVIDNADSISIISNGSDTQFNSMPYSLFNYLDYLNDAHLHVSNCIKATQSWNNNYDAIIYSTNVSPNDYDSNDYSNGANSVPNDNGIINLNDGSPMIGPFLDTLFSRLEGMCENDVYTNLQLTSLISRLASYPQPLLRSFLLSSRLTFSGEIRSLWNILSDLKHKIDSFASQINNFDILLRKGRSFLNAREDRLNDRLNLNNLYLSPQRRNSTSSVISNSDNNKDTRRKKRSIKDIFFPNRKSSPLPQNSNSPLPILESVSDGHGYRFFNNNFNRVTEHGIDAYEFEESERIQKTVMATLVFEEFLKELSAISYEHYILEKHNS